jgi:UDP-4-amino-4,6-dideoxy-N-acetyl-beta-L-altrosamine transaminase
MIPYGRQCVDQSDIDEVISVLKSDFLTTGPKVPEFESVIKTFVGAQHAVAVNSATSALHIACLALGLDDGDTLWTTPNTFVASANCALYCGASVDFVDIDPVSYNMCVQALEAKLKTAKQAGNLPKIVVPVHFGGLPCDMKRIWALSQEYGFNVIEDASHALGACSESQKIGNCRYSDITVFSFHPVKMITTGEGGMATTDCKKLSNKMNLLRSHGITRDPHISGVEMDGAWDYKQVTLGWNYRLTDIAASLGVAQMKKLPSFLGKRHKIAKLYTNAFSHLSIQLPVYRSKEKCSSLHLFVIQLSGSYDRGQIFRALISKNIGVNVHYIPVHTQPYFQRLGFRPGDFPIAEKFYTQAITLPCHPSMDTSQVNHVVNSVQGLLK